MTRERHPALLDTLAAAYAAAGRFDDAVATAEEAHKLAVESELEQLAVAIHARLALYRHGQAFRE